MAKNIRDKVFNEGDIVYWCHNLGNGKYEVKFGRVDKQFGDVVVIDYLETRDRRLVNDVPIKEFKDEQRYRKLPKGWNYNTELVKFSYSPLSEEEFVLVIDITNPKSIKEAYEKGYLVKAEENFHGNIEAEITKEGYRIIKKYTAWSHHINYISINPWKVYFTYDEAKKEVDDNIAEFTRQASLSDYEWSVEQIDKTLNRYKTLYSANEDQIQAIRDFLLGLDKVEDVEVRLHDGNIQWKYWKNKKWLNVEA